MRLNFKILKKIKFLFFNLIIYLYFILWIICPFFLLLLFYYFPNVKIICFDIPSLIVQETYATYWKNFEFEQYADYLHLHVNGMQQALIAYELSIHPFNNNDLTALALELSNQQFIGNINSFLEIIDLGAKNGSIKMVVAKYNFVRWNYNQIWFDTWKHPLSIRDIKFYPFNLPYSFDQLSSLPIDVNDVHNFGIELVESHIIEFVKVFYFGINIESQLFINCMYDYLTRLINFYENNLFSEFNKSYIKILREVRDDYSPALSITNKIEVLAYKGKSSGILKEFIKGWVKK